MLSDPTGNTTAWALYALGRGTGEQNALGASRRYVYLEGGRKVGATDRNNRAEH